MALIKKMKSTVLIITSVIFSFLPIFGQEFYSVIAENGLNVRNKPDLNSKLLGKFSCGEDLILLQKTDTELTLVDNEIEVTGYWYKMTSKTDLTGFVFSYYLLQKNESPVGRLNWNDQFGNNNTHLTTKNFDITIYNFQVEGFKEKHKDTLILFEEVFNEIGDKLVRIEPQKNMKIEVYYSYLETLNNWGSAKDSIGYIPKWSDIAPYIKLKKHNNFFYRIPPTEYEKIRETTAKKMNLQRSPDWENSGEGYWYPRYIYKGIVVPYEIKSVLFKIVTTDSNTNKSETKHMEIILSHGC